MSREFRFHVFTWLAGVLVLPLPFFYLWGSFIRSNGAAMRFLHLNSPFRLHCETNGAELDLTLSVFLFYLGICKGDVSQQWILEGLDPKTFQASWSSIVKIDRLTLSSSNDVGASLSPASISLVIAYRMLWFLYSTACAVVCVYNYEIFYWFKNCV